MPVAQMSGKVNEVHRGNTLPLPAVTFVFSRNNKDSVVLPHSTNACFSSFGIAVLGVHRNLSIS